MKTLLRNFLLIVLHLCLLLPANAQMFPSRQYTTEDELANSNVYDICHDNRGYFYESFNQKEFNRLIGREVVFVQDNHSKSHKGVLRGFQQAR